MTTAASRTRGGARNSARAVRGSSTTVARLYSQAMSTRGGTVASPGFATV